MSFVKMWDKILDFLFPKTCLGCRKEGSWLCQNCLSKIPTKDPPFLRTLDSNLEGIICLSDFKDPLKEAIHALKYDGVKELAGPLSDLLVKHLKDDRLRFVRRSILVPVPLHKSKELERGFNQSALLAKGISQKLNLKILDNCLVKIKKTKPQIELKGKERKENVKGAFAVFDKKAIKGKTILLVDDVMTTSSTLNECAKVLKKTGAKKIWGLVLAKD